MMSEYSKDFDKNPEKDIFGRGYLMKTFSSSNMDSRQISSRQQYSSIYKGYTLPHFPWASYTPLHASTHWCHSDTVSESLIYKEDDVNVADTKGRRPLHAAFYADNATKIHILASHSELVNKNYTDENGLSYLHIASAYNCIDIVRLILEEDDVDVNSSIHCNDKFAGYTALHFAAANGNLRIVELLMSRDADLTIQNPSGVTPLHLACYENHQDIVDFLVSEHYHNFNVNPVDNNGLSHFHIACTKYQPTVVKIFIDKGLVDINARVSDKSNVWPGCTPLHIAVENEFITTINILLRAGAKIDLQDNTGMTALHLACRLSPLKQAKLKMPRYFENEMIAYKGEYIPRSAKNLFKIERNTPYKGQNNQKLIVSLLVNAAANVNARDEKGKTPLMYLYDRDTDQTLSDNGQLPFIYHSVMSDRTDATKKLLDCGADPTISDNSGLTFLHMLSNTVFDGRYVFLLIKRLLSMKVDVNAKTIDGRTPLFLATLSNTKENIIRLLLEFGADPNAVAGKNLSTPFHNYASVGCRWLLGKFLHHGANVNHRLSSGQNVLHAIFSNKKFHRTIFVLSKDDKKVQINYFKALFNFKYIFDVNAQDSLGRTALHYACMRHDEYDVKILLDFGADIDIRDQTGKTPISYCRKNKCLAFIELYNHMVRRLRIGYQVSQQNITISEGLLAMTLSLRDSKDLDDANEENLKKIASEFEALKEIKLNEFVSMQDLLIKSPSELAIHVDNPVFYENVYSDEFENDFPFVIGLLRLQYQKGWTRKPLLRQAENAITSLIGIDFPNHCKNCILDNLNTRDIVRLTEAVKSI